MLARPGEARQKPTPTQRRRKVANNEDPNDTVRRLQRLPPNKACADCTSKLTQCVNLSHGTFVCMACSGVHREFSHKIKGIGHSSFAADEVAKLQHSNSGNEAVNARYLARYDARTARIKAPRNNNDLQHLRSWIRMKYIDKSWCERDSASQNNNSATKAAPPKSSAKRKPKSTSAPAPTAPATTPAADPFGFDSISSSANNSSWDAFGAAPAPPPASSFQADFGDMSGASPAPSAAPPAAAAPAFQADFGGVNGTMATPQQPPAPAAPAFQTNFGNSFSQPTMVSMPPPPQGQSQQQQQQGQPTIGNQQQQPFQANFNQGMMQPPSQQQAQQTPYQANFAQGQMMQQSQVQVNFDQLPQNNLMTATPQQQQQQQRPSFQANFEQSPAPMPPQQQQQQQKPSFQANFAQSHAPIPPQQQQQQQQPSFQANFEQSPAPMPPQQQQQQPSFQANFAQSHASMPVKQQQQQLSQEPSQINAGSNLSQNVPEIGGEVTMNEQSSGMNFGQFPDQSQQVMNGQQEEMGTTNQSPPAPPQTASMSAQPNTGMSIPEVTANQSLQLQQDAPSGAVNPNAFKQADDKKDAFSAFDGLSLEPTNSAGGAMTPAQDVSTHASEKANLQFSRFKEGQQVIYTNSQGSVVAFIKKVHFDDDLEPFYTIDLNGREKQTDDAHLSLPNESLQNQPSNESSPSAKLEETTAMLKNLSDSQLSEVQKFISTLFSASAQLPTPSMGMTQQQQAGNVADSSKQQMNGTTHQQASNTMPSQSPNVIGNDYSMPLPQMTSFQESNLNQAATSNMAGAPTQMNTSQPMMQMQQYPPPQMYTQQPPMQQQQTAQPLYTQQQATGMANGSMPQMSMQQPQNNTGSAQIQLQSPNPSMTQPMAPQQYAPSPVMAPTAPPPNCLSPVEKEGNPFDMY